MEVVKTIIDGCYLLSPKVYNDERGFFMESFNKALFEESLGLNVNFVQDNISQSSYGVIRGLHAQRGEHAQAKLVSVIAGEVLDVVVDLRLHSPSYGKVVSEVLNEENKRQLFVPRGCFHGFAVLSDKVTFFYKCDNFYNSDADYGIAYNDDSLQIDWKIPFDKRTLSSKDLALPRIKDLN